MILVMIAVIFMTNVLGRHWDFEEMNRISQTIQSPFQAFGCLSSIILLFCVMSAIAMAFVMGAPFSKLMKLKEWCLGWLHGWCDFLYHDPGFFC